MSSTPVGGGPSSPNTLTPQELGRKERREQRNNKTLSARTSRLPKSDSIGEGFRAGAKRGLDGDFSYSSSNYTNKRKAYATLFAVATIASAVALGVITGGSVFGIIAIGATIFTGYAIIKRRWADWGKNGWTWKKDLTALLLLGAAPLISHLAIVPPSGGPNWLASIFARIGGATMPQFTAVITSVAVAVGIASVESYSWLGRGIDKDNKDLKNYLKKNNVDLSDIDKKFSRKKRGKLFRKKLDELPLKKLQKEEAELKAEVALVLHSPSAKEKKSDGTSITYLDAFEHRFRNVSLEERIEGLNVMIESKKFKADKIKSATVTMAAPKLPKGGPPQARNRSNRKRPSRHYTARLSPSAVVGSPDPLGKLPAYLDLAESASKRPKKKRESLLKADKIKSARLDASPKKTTGTKGKREKKLPAPDLFNGEFEKRFVGNFFDRL